MPITRLICPHCEENVEVSLTSVTRSRDCPLCGGRIVIEHGPDTGSAGGAGLPNAALVEGPVLEEHGEGVVPKVLSGDLRRRMMHDPEVLARIRMLKIGVTVAGAIVVLLVVADSFHFWSGTAKMANWVGTTIRPGAAQEQTVDTDPPAALPRVELPPAPVDPVPMLAPAAETTLPEPSKRPASAPAVAAAERPKSEQELALEAVSAFLAAANVDERLKHVRDRKLVEPKMREYYSRRPDGPFEFESADVLEENPKGPYTFTFNVVLPDGGRRSLLVGKTFEGRYAVDWASFVLYGELEWLVFREKRPSAPVMFRVLAAPGALFQGAFSDAAGLLCVKLVNPAALDQAPLFGYARRDTAVAATLESALGKAPGRSVPMMVRLKYPPEVADASQVWIDEVIGEGWVSRKW